MLPLLFVAALVAAPQDAPKPATNTTCPVTGEKITAKKPATVVVKGQTYNLCCGNCTAAIQKDPDKYLNPDGSLKKH